MATDKDISFATFNLYNLQLPGLAWRSDPYTQDAYDAKIAWSARMLLRLNADIIAFQELWSAQCLIDLFSEARLSQDYELHFLRGPDDKWYDIAVAVAVRKPWVSREKRLHKEFGPGVRLIKRGDDDPEDNEIEVKITKFSRTVIDLELVHTDRPEVPAFRLLACHLKSKLATWLDEEEREDDAIRGNATALGAALSTIRRTAEAAALRDVLNGILRDNDTPVVVLGDLNDGAASNTVSILTEQPSYRLFEASTAGLRSDRGLYAASRLQSYRLIGGEEHTHEHKGEREILDHVLVSEQFYDHSKNRLWSFEDMRVWNDHIDDERPRFPSSDHGLVRARFNWRPLVRV